MNCANTCALWGSMKETDYADIVSPLLAWYAANGRDLPWRNTRDPYRIWLSEIMLQQTRVEAVKDYYARFLKTLPTIADLAAAPEEKLLKLWEGLGYYSRVRNMQKAARTVIEDFGGSLPADHDALLSLSGIGPYTAAAVSSIAFSIPRAVVDGNVLRVFTRICADETDIGDPRFKKKVGEKLDAIIPHSDPGAFNQAMMDLGAMVCAPAQVPRCDVCPLSSLCRAHLSHTETSYPVKSSKKPRKTEKMTVFLIRDGERYAIRKRKNGGLLAGMYEPPHADGWLNEEEALIFIKGLHLDPMHIERIEDARHVFTHKEWHMIAYEVRVGFPATGQPQELIFADRSMLQWTYPLPSAFAVYKKHMGL